MILVLCLLCKRQRIVYLFQWPWAQLVYCIVSSRWYSSVIFGCPVRGCMLSQRQTSVLWSWTSAWYLRYSELSMSVSHVHVAVNWECFLQVDLSPAGVPPPRSVDTRSQIPTGLVPATVGHGTACIRTDFRVPDLPHGASKSSGHLLRIAGICLHESQKLWRRVLFPFHCVACPVHACY